MVEARNPQETENAFAVFAMERTQAVLVATDEFFGQRQQLAEFALRDHLPSMFSQREYVEAGGLMSYGENLADFFRRAASFVDKIFKGAKPGDLPIEQPTKFNLVINRKTADALGVIISAAALHLCRRGDRMRRREFITFLGGRRRHGRSRQGRSSRENCQRSVCWPPTRLAPMGSGLPLCATNTRARWIDGQTVVLEIRWANGRTSVLPKSRPSSIRMKAEAIVSREGSAYALKQATRVIPIVFATADDPIVAVWSSAWRGRVATLRACQTIDDLAAKRLELLREVVPSRAVSR